MVDSFLTTATALIQHETNLWTYEGSVTVLYGLFRLPTRMTIIRLSKSNQLMVISPFPPTDLLQTLLAEIGQVQYIIIPNEHHTFWALTFLAQYPQAYLIATCGMKSNEKFQKYIHAYFTNDGLEYNPHCTTTLSFDWPVQDIEYYCFYHVKHINEVMFYHRPTSTLIVTDLAFNYYEESSEQRIRAQGFLFRSYLWLADGYRRACVTKPFRYFFKNDLEGNKQDFDEMLTRYRNFDRLIVAHGMVIEHGGYDALKSGTYKLFLDCYKKTKERPRSWSTEAKLGIGLITGTVLLYLCQRYFSPRSLLTK
ncbi:unnamed protein product [Adineta ricciae]|uniref:DUF4336 domain-containing protein n=1 Tax=Adineta ricciae TaxID=249248 RepID=A0A815NCL6_ADIRI|nr:unnamed protein product [Adineta ricciae]CAF1432102.1 unnamed protein product [Adineta ricciae]